MRLSDTRTRPQINSGKMSHIKVADTRFMFLFVCFFNLFSVSQDFTPLIQSLWALSLGEGESRVMEWFN